VEFAVTVSRLIERMFAELASALHGPTGSSGGDTVAVMLPIIPAMLESAHSANIKKSAMIPALLLNTLNVRLDFARTHAFMLNHGEPGY